MLQFLLAALAFPVLAQGARQVPATVSAEAPAREALRAKLQEKLEAIHAAGTFPGACAGFALASGESFAIVTGLADRESARALSPDDRMLAGSVGKTFFAALALQLASETKLDLDQKISKWFESEPWFARLPNAHEITVRMLLNHTSGLVRYEFRSDFERDLVAHPDRVWKPEEQIAYLLDSEPPFAAGKGWDYSDTNYLVLGMILERITGKKAYDEIRRRFVEPLALARTVPSDRRVIEGLAQGYAGENNAFGDSDAMLVEGKFVFNPQFEWAGGGYASTAGDLARWAKALYGGRVLDEARMREVLDGVDAPMLGPGVKYGLCVIVRDTPLGPSWGHSGFFPGYLSEMRYYPEHELGVAVQVNTSDGTAVGKSLGAILHELATIAVEKK